MKPTRTISSQILLMGVLGLAIVGGILAYQIYSASVKSQTTAEQKEAIKPIDGTIKQTVIDNLQKREVYSEDQMDELLGTSNIEESTETTIATSEGTLTTTPTGSPEATGAATQ